MVNHDPDRSEDPRLEQFDNPPLGSGRRDTGTDAPEPGSGGRPVGTVAEDKNPPISDPAASDVYGGTGEIRPQDTDSAVPPYEGRKEAGTVAPAGTRSTGGVNTAGATGPVADADGKSDSPSSTPGTATTSPADEQPATETSESDLGDDRTGPSHVSGMRRGESAR